MSMDANTTEPIRVTVTPTREEFVRFHMRFALGRTGTLLFFGLLWVAVILYALYGAPMLAQGRAGNQAVSRNASLFAAIFTSVVLVVSIPLGTYIAAVRRWSAAAEVREQRQYTFTDEGIQVTGETFA